MFNSGLTTTNNSDPTNALNNGRTALIAAGIEYAKGASTLTGLASISDQTFSNRGTAATDLGLATNTDFHSFTLNYTREINANLSVSGIIGLVGVTKRIFSWSAQNNLANLHCERELGVDAEAGAERVRVQNHRSADDGHRERGAEL